MRNPQDIQLAFTFAEVCARLAWLLDEIDDRADVCDGSDGQQMPNEAMRLQMAYHERFAR